MKSRTSCFRAHRQVHWAQTISRDEFTAALARAVEICVSAGLAEQKNEALEINVVGRACATKGIGAKTGIVLARWARESASLTLSELEVLTVASFTDAGDGLYVSLGKDERYKADYRAQLLASAATAGGRRAPNPRGTGSRKERRRGVVIRNTRLLKVTRSRLGKIGHIRVNYHNLARDPRPSGASGPSRLP